MGCTLLPDDILQDKCPSSIVEAELMVGGAKRYLCYLEIPCYWIPREPPILFNRLHKLETFT